MAPETPERPRSLAHATRRGHLGTALDVAAWLASPQAPEEPVLVHRAVRTDPCELSLEDGYGPMAAWSALDVDFEIVVYAPGACSAPRRQGRPGSREFGVLLSGALTVTVGAQAHVLAAGDSITFDASIPHRLHNDGPAEARAMWLTLGEDASAAGSPRG